MTTQIELKRGGHTTREDGMCLMEAVAFVAGEPHSDRPQCTCPVLAAFARGLNDAMDDELRQKHLAPLVERLVGTRDPGLERKRAYVLVDFAVREAAAAALDAANIPHSLDSLDPVVDKDTADTARAAAWAAARDATWAAAAARDATWDADLGGIWEAATAALVRAIEVTK